VRAQGNSIGIRWKGRKGLGDGGVTPELGGQDDPNMMITCIHWLGAPGKVQFQGTVL
jgi:hypothetical protein